MHEGRVCWSVKIEQGGAGEGGSVRDALGDRTTDDIIY